MRGVSLIACISIAAFAHTATAATFCERFGEDDCFVNERRVIVIVAKSGEVPAADLFARADQIRIQRYGVLRSFFHNEHTMEQLMLWTERVRHWPYVLALADENLPRPPRSASAVPK